MPIERATLVEAISASGGAVQPDDQVDGLLAKLRALEATGRYASLLKGISSANDKSNFLSLLLEATFAYQFESRGLSLDYEVKQGASEGSSIDFGLKLGDAGAAYFELRLLQQDQATATKIAQQLTDAGLYAVIKDGVDEQREILKLQSIVLSKVEDKHGKPTKFLKVDPGAFNVVAVCVSDLLLGMADLHDCILATYGDPEVPEECRRGIFGLFQDLKPVYPAEIQVAAKRFAHLKATIHAVLFLFKPNGSGILDYSLQQLLVWNRALTTEADAGALNDALCAAIAPFK
ncbi:hypothetical protein [Piscinibacter koreensis]|jgi:hypothetical protein|uniref:Uncharacterized protein n=1 Tax=Piscinibacter koreensis TaxID=2742824 RepID=A0A7Y6NSS3_9BURK|nr:hypothetical protein [Schlegelella koreensis]NUZ08665.1 hypothetical protein [Schlegelella koreensis]